jgi:hypothetical protein
MEGMAFYNPSEAQIYSFENTVSFDGFIGVTGAGGIEPAIASQQWRDSPLIKPNHQ